MPPDAKSPGYQPGMAVLPSRPHPAKGKAIRFLLSLALVAFAIVQLCGNFHKNRSVEQQLESQTLDDESFKWEDVCKSITLGCNVLTHSIRLLLPSNSYTIHALVITNALACRFQ